MRAWNGPSWWSLSLLIIACVIPDKKCWWNGFRHTFEIEQSPCHTSSANIGHCVCSCLVWCNGKLWMKFWCALSSRELYRQARGCHRNRAAPQGSPQTPPWDRGRRQDWDYHCFGDFFSQKGVWFWEICIFILFIWDWISFMTFCKSVKSTWAEFTCQFIELDNALWCLSLAFHVVKGSCHLFWEILTPLLIVSCLLIV